MIWNRFVLWLDSEEPTKPQPTSLSRVNIPKFEVLEDKAGPDERRHFHLVRVWATIRLVLLFLLWIFAGVAYFYPVNTNAPVFLSPGHYVTSQFATIEIAASAAFAIAFLWSIPRRKYFTRTIIKTDLRHVAWSRYYAISKLQTFKKTMGLIVVVSFLITIVRAAYHWGQVDEFYRLFFLSFGLVLVVYLLLYSLVLWRSESLRANLDEYHEELMNEIREGTKDENKITIPTRSTRTTHTMYALT